MPPVDTETIRDQNRVQASIDELYGPYLDGHRSTQTLRLHRKLHADFLRRGLEQLPSAFVVMDSNIPWLCYWILQSLDLLGEPISNELGKRVVQTLGGCQHPSGGFGGGPNQMPHLAATFAAVSALAVVGSAEAYESIDRAGLVRFLNDMKQPNGSFAMQADGEICCRGAYCAVAVAALTGLLDSGLGLAGCAEYIAACQTYEGGIGTAAFAEAHAGYSYCGFAALCLLGKSHLLDREALGRFARRSQCSLSGGFRGRTNKLVDGCYSFWAGALFPLLRQHCPDWPALDSDSLQRYILVCGQNDSTGGLRDKPEKREDYYHTCYCLAGLSIAQHEPGAAVLGDARTNQLPEIDPLHNLLVGTAQRMKSYFGSKYRH